MEELVSVPRESELSSPPPQSRRYHHHHFSSLPLELQVKIWKLTIPTPSSIISAILLTLSHSHSAISTPYYALLPCLPSLKSAFYNPFVHRLPNHHRNNNYGQKQHPLLQIHLNKAIKQYRLVLSLLHTSHISRSLTLQRYRLDLASIIQDENKPFWNEPQDIVNFSIRTDHFINQRVDINLLFGTRKVPRSCLSGLQHVSFVFLPAILKPLDLERGEKVGTYAWVDNLPSLKSFRLLFDKEALDGDVLEEDELIEAVSKLTLAQIRERVRGGLRREGIKKGGDPLVQCVVAKS